MLFGDPSGELLLQLVNFPSGAVGEDNVKSSPPISTATPPACLAA